jgi:Tol biopolymer transport system component
MRWALRSIVIAALVGAGVGHGTAGAQESDEDLTVPTAPDDWVDPEKGTLEGQGSPLDDLPPHITLVSDFGLRPDWSPEGDKLLYMDKAPLGDAWELDLESGESRPITDHFEHMGLTRAHYLANGDVLLCGPTSGPVPSDDRPEAGRFTGTMSVLRAPFDEPPQPLGMPCWEGVTTSDTSMRIAWNRSDIDYTAADLVDRVVFGVSEIWTGEIIYRDGQATLVDSRMAVDRSVVTDIAVLEVQDFRPPDEEELIFTAYAYEGGEVMGIDLETGEVRNYSNSDRYEEAEAVAPDGSFVLVERDLESAAVPSELDIWWLSLDGESTWERLTFFNRYGDGQYASNPSVSPDGTRFAFQLSINEEVEGEGAGILLYDLEAVDLPDELVPTRPVGLLAVDDELVGSGGDSDSSGRVSWPAVVVLVVLMAAVGALTGGLLTRRQSP